jgi:hypothetical protein
VPVEQRSQRDSQPGGSGQVVPDLRCRGGVEVDVEADVLEDLPDEA